MLLNETRMVWLYKTYCPDNFFSPFRPNPLLGIVCQAISTITSRRLYKTPAYVRCKRLRKPESLLLVSTLEDTHRDILFLISKSPDLLKDALLQTYFDPEQNPILYGIRRSINSTMGDLLRSEKRHIDRLVNHALGEERRKRSMSNSGGERK